jgi:hypothetical protein
MPQKLYYMSYDHSLLGLFLSFARFSFHRLLILYFLISLLILPSISPPYISCQSISIAGKLLLFYPGYSIWTLVDLSNTWSGYLSSAIGYERRVTVSTDRRTPECYVLALTTCNARQRVRGIPRAANSTTGRTLQGTFLIKPSVLWDYP